MSFWKKYSANACCAPKELNSRVTSLNCDELLSVIILRRRRDQKICAKQEPAFVDKRYTEFD